MLFSSLVAASMRTSSIHGVSTHASRNLNYYSDFVV